VANGIAWLDDIQSFYRERSAIEKEYSAKLNALAKKYFEKKTRKSTSLSVGDTPTMTPGSLERYDPGMRGGHCALLTAGLTPYFAALPSRPGRHILRH
jgi:hypothetical protein